MKKKIIIGISGASGAIYGVRALQLLKDNGVETHLVITKAAELTLANENQHNSKALSNIADFTYKLGDIGAAIASGSFKTDGMLIAPCSIKTMSEIAYGMTSNLLTRAADVQLKERRRVVMMVRETPFHLGHLQTMTQLTQMGAIIFPPVPAFYSNLESIDDMVDQSIARALDLLNVEIPILRRWGKEN
jgi:flavin prenyltransferase